MYAGYKLAEATRKKNNNLSAKNKWILKKEEVNKENEINNCHRERYAAKSVQGTTPKSVGILKSLAFQMPNHVPVVSPIQPCTKNPHAKHIYRLAAEEKAWSSFCKINMYPTTGPQKVRR